MQVTRKQEHACWAGPTSFHREKGEHCHAIRWVSRNLSPHRTLRRKVTEKRACILGRRHRFISKKHKQYVAPDKGPLTRVLFKGKRYTGDLNFLRIVFSHYRDLVSYSERNAK